MKRKRIEACAPSAVAPAVEIVPAIGTAKEAADAARARSGARDFETGKVTKRFKRLADDVAQRYAESFRELSK